VVLHEKVAGGVVRAEVLGPERKLTVSYFRRIDDISPFEVERETDKLPAGERVVTQRGVPGFVAQASRVVRDGAYAERTKWREKYPPTTQIVSVGTGPEEMKPRLVQDNHPEYRVDEYLVLTQGPGSKKSEASSMLRSPVKDRTGEAGWIKALGFEKTPIEDVKVEDKDKVIEGEPKSKKEKEKDKPKEKDKAKEKDKGKDKKPKKEAKKQ
jgi:hypothetical protein